MMFRSNRVNSLDFLLHLPRARWCAQQMLQLQIVPALFAHRNQDIIPEPLACGAFQSEVLE